MKSEWIWHCFISIIMIPVLLFTSVKIVKTPHAEDIKQHFLEHQEEFKELTFELMSICYRNAADSSYLMLEKGRVVAEGAEYVGKIGSMDFYNFGQLIPQKEYENMYNIVSGHLDSLNLCCIAMDRGGIQFTISFSYYGSCRLFFIPFGGLLEIDAPDGWVKEKIRICDGWYAVVTYD